MDKLKACPFCGGKAETVEYSDGSGHVECASCGFEALGMFSWGGEKSRKAEAIAAWNRRADDAELARYKQLEADGLLVVLPCKVGDTVHCVAHGESILEQTATGFECWNGAWRVRVFNVNKHGYRNDHLVPFGDFGETVFLTREAAQAALEGAGG